MPLFASLKKVPQLKALNFAGTKFRDFHGVLEINSENTKIKELKYLLNNEEFKCLQKISTAVAEYLHAILVRYLKVNSISL